VPTFKYQKRKTKRICFKNFSLKERLMDNKRLKTSHACNPKLKGYLTSGLKSEKVLLLGNFQRKFIQQTLNERRKKFKRGSEVAKTSPFLKSVFKV